MLGQANHLHITTPLHSPLVVMCIFIFILMQLSFKIINISIDQAHVTRKLLVILSHSHFFLILCYSY